MGRKHKINVSLHHLERLKSVNGMFGHLCHGLTVSFTSQRTTQTDQEQRNSVESTNCCFDFVAVADHVFCYYHPDNDSYRREQSSGLPLVELRLNGRGLSSSGNQRSRWFNALTWTGQTDERGE